MTQSDWQLLLKSASGTEIKSKEGIRPILKSEIVIKLRPSEEPKDKKELSRIWLTDVAARAEKILAYFWKAGIPYIIADTGEGIDIHVFASNLETIAKQDQVTGKDEITALMMAKKIVEQIILVRAELLQQVSVSYKMQEDDGKVLQIGSKSVRIDSYKTMIFSLKNKKYIKYNEVRYPKQIKIWKIPQDFASEVLKCMPGKSMPDSQKERQNSPYYDYSMISDCYRFLAHENETEIRLINPNMQGYVRSFFVRSRDELYDLVEQWSKRGYNFYVGINERNTGGKKGIDVKSAKTLVIDIDAIRTDKSVPDSERKKLPATQAELDLAEEQADIIIKDEFVDKGFKKPVKCMSGNGWQLWTAIPSIEITDVNRERIDVQIQNFNRAIREKYSDGIHASIDNIGDLARVIKLIGTKSIKGRETPIIRPHRMTYSVEPLERDEDPKLKEYILSLPADEEAAKASKSLKTQPLETAEALTVEEKIARICQKDRKLKMLIQGSTEGFASRSEAEASLISKLIYYQFDKDAIFHILDNSGCTKWKDSSEQYKNTSYSNSLSFIMKKHENFGEYLKGGAERRFLAMMLTDQTNLEIITELVKKSGLIPYDGSAKPHKVYHVTLQPPKQMSKEECMRILQDKYQFELEAESKKIQMFSNKIVAILGNLHAVKGRTEDKDIEKYLASLYKADFPFKAHMTIAEGDKEQIKSFYKRNKKAIEKELAGLKFRFQPVFITKDKGVNE
ncbi:MAG: hypothetical protein ABII22_04480 [Candidatus Micrarchaeota archaeon]